MTTASGTSRARAHASAAASYLLGLAFHTFKLKAGGFDAALYAGDVAANADFRKFDDGLRMTLDCSPAFADALEARLAAAEDFANWGAVPAGGGAAHLLRSLDHRARTMSISSTAPAAAIRWPPRR